MQTGNFSQVVWRRSREVGVGYARNPRSGEVVVAALYHPPGNLPGLYRENVPLHAFSTC